MTMQFSTDGFYRDIIKLAVDQNWKVGRTSKNHLRFISPDGKGMVITSSTASDRKSVKNFLARMKRNGFIYNK